MRILRYYKSISKRVRRLPLDGFTLSLLQKKVKLEFLVKSSYSTVNAKKYNQGLEVFDSFLVDENFEALDTILDYVFKDRVINKPWAHEFLQENCMSFKDIWPQVHLIREFGDTTAIENYDEQLRKKSALSDFSLMKYLNLTEDRTLELIRHSAGNDSHKKKLESIVEELRKFHGFLTKHQGSLLKQKIPHFEVVYEPNKFGLPRGTIELQKAYKTKVNGMKQLLRKFRPMEKEHVDHLIAFCHPQPGSTKYMVNPNFFKYMGAKHLEEAKTVSPLVRTYLRKRLLVPNDKAIRDYMKDYTKKQFYIESGNYVLSPLRFFYTAM